MPALPRDRAGLARAPRYRRAQVSGLRRVEQQHRDQSRAAVVTRRDRSDARGDGEGVSAERTYRRVRYSVAALAVDAVTWLAHSTSEALATLQP